METLVWLALFVALLAIELITLGLTTIWFAGGALLAALASFLGLSLTVQVVVFLAVSVLLLALTRPVAVKYFNQDRIRTNAESLIGRQAVVTEEIDTLRSVGQVEVNGQIWSARTGEPDGRIPKDRVVTIDGIRGVKLIVRMKEGEEL